MQSLAERVSSGWWVAKTKPSRTMQFAKQLDAPEVYVPVEKSRRPLVPYVFIRAIGRVNAWMCPGFNGWLQTGGARAIVPDDELQRFRTTLEPEAKKPERKFGKCRVLLRINANTEIRAEI